MISCSLVVLIHARLDLLLYFMFVTLVASLGLFGVLLCFIDDKWFGL